MVFRYKSLKAELSSATTQGEELLTQVRKPNLTYNIISHVAAVERYTRRDKLLEPCLIL